MNAPFYTVKTEAGQVIARANIYGDAIEAAYAYHSQNRAHVAAYLNNQARPVDVLLGSKLVTRI